MYCVSSDSGHIYEICLCRQWYVFRVPQLKVRSANVSLQQSFMSAGSITLGGNLSIAIGPLGRNGEASGSLNTKGKMAAMYSYSKTRGLFGGVSLEGSVIVERQDANAQAYRSDVTARSLLSGSIPPPEWASVLINTLEQCTGVPGNSRWVSEHYNNSPREGYMFNSVASPRDEGTPSKSRSTRPSNSRKNSYFDFNDDAPGNGDLQSDSTTSYGRGDRHAWANSSSYNAREANGDHDRDQPTTDYFDTKFESDFLSNDDLRKHPQLSSSSRGGGDYAFKNASESSTSHRRSVSAYTPPSSSRFSENPFEAPDEFDYAPRRQSSRGSKFSRGSRSYDFDRDLDDDDVDADRDVFGAPIPNAARAIKGSSPPPPKLAPKAELTRPLKPSEGIARAIALFDFNAVQVSRLRLSCAVPMLIERNRTAWGSFLH